MMEGVGIKGRGGGSKLPRRHYGPYWRRHNRGYDQYSGRGAGQQLSVSKEVGGIIPEGTGRIQVYGLSQIIVEWCGAGQGQGVGGCLEVWVIW